MIRVIVWRRHSSSTFYELRASLHYFTASCCASVSSSCNNLQSQPIFRQLKRQVERENGNLNPVLRRLYCWEFSLRVNHPVRNIGCMREAVVDFVDHAAVLEPCSDRDNNIETWQNM